MSRRPAKTEFIQPAVAISVGPAHQSALWSTVSRSRKLWLRSLVGNEEVHVLDDYGNVWKTHVRGVRHAPFRRRGSLEPQIWLWGHPACYAAARVFRPGTVPGFEDMREEALDAAEAARSAP